MNLNVHGADQPVIVKYAVSQRNGVQALNLSRNGIGYLTRGRKYIHYGDIRYEISKGDIFFLNVGTHYIEDIPEDDRPFEQFMFYYTPEMISDMLSILSVNFGMEIVNDHKCDKCSTTNHASTPAWGMVRTFFACMSQYIKEDEFTGGKVVQKMKMTELICLILSHSDCCIKAKILTNITEKAESFERLVQMNIFEDISIEELAERCGRSHTSFKKEFKKHFHESPHRWIIRQRLTHARMLLISTSRTIADIGNECMFQNTSHFIKLFRNEFGFTPATYRAKSLRDGEPRKKHDNVKVY